MFSIICAYNKEKILNKYLLKSLETQSAKYELILFKNAPKKNSVKSSAELMNRLCKKAHGKYLMFVHQDILFTSSYSLENIEKAIDQIPNLGIIGVAGQKKEGLFYLVDSSHKGLLISTDNVTASLTEVQTLDSCAAIIPKSVYNRLHFDEKTINGWYFYIVDYCLSLKDLGYGVYAMPMPLDHMADRRGLESGYYIGLLKILLKHRKHGTIYTTVGNWNLQRYVLDAPFNWIRGKIIPRKQPKSDFPVVPTVSVSGHSGQT